MIERSNLPQRFWEKGLQNLSQPEWEALCDGCGKCCLQKIEYEDPVEVHLTCVGCTLLDTTTGGCSNYANRHDFVPNCVVLTPQNINDVAYYMPQTCAYKRLHEGKPLPAWHPLLTGRQSSVTEAGVSIAGWALSENDIHEDDWENHLIHEPLGPVEALGRIGINWGTDEAPQD